MEKWLKKSKEIEQLEEQDRFLNDQKLKDVLNYFKWLANSNDLKFIDYAEEENTKDRFLKNYIELSKRKPEDIKLYLKKRNYKEASMLYELLYMFIEQNKMQEIANIPLVKDMQMNNGIYDLTTTLGKIRLSKASEYFKNTSLALQFKKNLRTYCFERTEDFVLQSPEYQAMVVSSPNIFTGTHLHAYAKKDDIIVDSACNAVFFDKTGEILEQGNIVYQTDAQKLQQEAVRDDCSRLYVATMKNKVMTKR